MNNFVLADSIRHVRHYSAFDQLVKSRFKKLELEVMLVYFIDLVPQQLIPYHAKYFDVLGYKGMRLAKNEQDQREIIKRAFELHKYKGTRWALEEALQSIGFGESEIEENLNQQWGVFRVTLDLFERPLNISEIEDIKRMIYEYKNARSKLEDISYRIAIDAEFLIQDEHTVAQSVESADTFLISGQLVHNGEIKRNGQHNYSKDTDTLTIELI